ncbi:MAG: sn-glycerol-3-phosphate ABC transporter ATP-binding protein UgpC [Planctomycetota bacterium]
MAEVTLDNVTKVYSGDVVAVSDITLHVVDMELLVLVGPSGCGKSTTLRIIAGLEEATRGTVRIGGRVVNDVPPKDRDIAMVFQNYALYPHMTVYKNMAFGLKLRKYPRADIDRRVNETASLLGIQDLLDRKPKALSGGERQRVALGRAIVRQPAAFLFDEPLSNLDAKLRVGMRAELNKLHHRLGTTMIYVTHDQVEAMTLGDRIAVMNDGIIQQLASPLELYDRPENRFVAGFLGTPPMNFLNGRIETDNGSVLFNEGSARIVLPGWAKRTIEALPGREAVLGARPEDITIGAGPGDVRARVNVVEPLGDEMIVYLSTDYHDLVCKAPSHQKTAVDDDVGLTFDTGKAHLFDPETGKNVSLAQRGRPAA